MQQMDAHAPPVTLSGLLERLALLGLQEREALRYVHLCIRGPAKASEVAAATRLHRTEVYRGLDTLLRKGLATATLDRPTRYEATSPERVFDEALALHDKRRGLMEEAR